MSAAEGPLQHHALIPSSSAPPEEERRTETSLNNLHNNTQDPQNKISPSQRFQAGLLLFKGPADVTGLLFFPPPS